MEIHRQCCQTCGTPDVRNIVVREPGQPLTIFVQCAGCLQLVARYRLSDCYVHGQGLETWLRSLGPATAESGRDFHGEFERIRQDAVTGYQAALRELSAMGPEVSDNRPST